jgi:hypothetical protein
VVLLSVSLGEAYEGVAIAKSAQSRHGGFMCLL